MKLSRYGPLALAGVALFASPQAQAQQAKAPTSYQDIGFDCGGWFVGFATTNVSGRIYGYGDVFGVWRSDNYGETWKSLQLGFTSNKHFTVGVGVKTDNADVLGFTDVYTGFYRSNDGGASWNQVIPIANGDRVYGSTQLVSTPWAGRTNEWILARKRSTTGYTTGQLWRSTNGLSSNEADWQKLGGSAFDGTVKPRTVYMHPNWPGQIWVGTEDATGTGGGLWVSVNDGVSFTQVWGGDSATDPNQQGPGQSKPVVNSIVRRPDGTGYLGSNVGGILISSTNNWGTPSPTTYTGYISVSRENGAPITSVAVLPSGAFVSGQDPSRGSDPTKASVIRVTDDTPSPADGKNSTSLLPKLDLLTPVPAWATPPTAEARNLPDSRSMIAIDPSDPTRWYTTGGQSPFLSTDSGVTWKYPPLGSGLAAMNTYGVNFIRSATTAANANKVFVSGADHGIITLTDGGASGLVASALKRIVPKHTTFKNIMSVDGQTIVGAGWWQGAGGSSLIVRSIDGGLNWSIIPTPKPGQPVGSTDLPIAGGGITRSVMSLTNHNDFIVMQGGGEFAPANPGIWRTQDGGTTWVKAAGLPSTFDGGRWVDFARSWLENGGPDFPNHRYAFFRDSGFWRSTDGGSNWSQTGGVTQPGTTWNTGFAVDQAPGKGGTIWIAHDSDSFTLKKSTNQGASWVTVPGFTRALRVSAYDGRVAVWGKRTGDTDWRLYYSPDSGATWTAHTDTTNQTVANSLRYGHFNNVFVDPYRVGKLWITGLTSVHVIDTAAEANPVITSAFTASGTMGSTFSYTITATSTPVATMTYSAEGLPAGLTLNSTTGVISGTPQTEGTYDIIISATGAHRTSEPELLELTVSAAPQLLIVSEPFAYALNTTNPDPDGSPTGSGLPASNQGGTPSGTSTGLRGSWGAPITVVNGLSYTQGTKTLSTSAQAARASTAGWGALLPVYRNMTVDPFLAQRVNSSPGGNFGVSGTSLYVSFLAQTSSTTAGAFRLAFKHSSGSDNFHISNTTTGWALNNGATVVTASSAPLATGTPTLMVMRFDFGSTTTVNLWVNPALGNTLGSPNATVTGVTLPGIMALQPNPAVGNAMTLDEFRLGTTQQSVMPSF